MTYLIRTIKISLLCFLVSYIVLPQTSKQLKPEIPISLDQCKNMSSHSAELMIDISNLVMYSAENNLSIDCRRNILTIVDNIDRVNSEIITLLDDKTSYFVRKLINDMIY